MTFELGTIVCTLSIRDLIGQGERQLEVVQDCLRRHSDEDWGDLCEEDKELNDQALENER